MDLVRMEPMRMLPIKLTLLVATMAVNLAGGEPTGMFEEVQPSYLSKFNHFSRFNRQTSQSTSPGPTLDLPTPKS